MKVLSSLFLGLFISVSALADIPFTREAFKKSQENNEKIILQLHAGWCHICQNEDLVFKKLREEDYFKGVTFYKIDFDKEKELMTEMKMQYAGLLILFQGNKEVGRIPSIKTEKEFKSFTKSFMGK